MTNLERIKSDAKSYAYGHETRDEQSYIDGAVAESEYLIKRIREIIVINDEMSVTDLVNEVLKLKS